MSNKTMPLLSELQKDIYRIAIPLRATALGTINAYIIRGEDRSILIDTGYRMGLCVDAIRDSFHELGLDLQNTDILLTHFHNDHSGSSTEVIQPGRSIYVPEQEFPYFAIGSQPGYYQESRRPIYVQEGIAEDFFDRFMRVKAGRSTGPDFFSSQFVPVRDGEEISAGDHTLKAIHTPGHTPGHFCYWDEKNRIMFTGDHVLFDITPNIIPWAGIPNILSLYMQSLIKIRDYPAAMALPGHRAPGDLYKRVDEVISHHHQRLDECEELIKSHPDLTALDLTKMLSWNVTRRDGKEGIPFHLLRYAFGECLAHLDFLRLQNRIVREKDSDGFWRYR